MSNGRIVHEPLVVRGHRCRPPGPDSLLETDLLLSDCPSGTVWECVCGKTWVSGRGAWHREGRFARWRRERRGHREQNREAYWERQPGAHLLDDVEPSGELPSCAAIHKHGPECDLDADGLPPWGPDRWQEPRSDRKETP